jgi:hypothetical protein
MPKNKEYDILLSYSSRDKLLYSLDELYEKLNEAELDVQEGKTYTHKEVMARLEV